MAFRSTAEALARARSAHMQKRWRDAESTLLAALAQWPGDVDAHIALARLRWLHDPEVSATIALETAIDARPADLKLRLVCADLLRCSGRAEDALAMLEEGLRRAPGSPAFTTSIGVILDDLGRADAAHAALRAAVAAAPHRADTRANLLPFLLRTGAADEAHAITRALLAQNPEDQHLIAHQALALRLLGDPAYGDLYDYPRLVRIYDLPVPPDYADAAAFNAALAARLESLHWALRHPIDQSLRGGTQSDGTLDEHRDPIIDAFLVALNAPIQDYISRLNPAKSHPIDRRATGGFRLTGSWSVRLDPGGRHLNHVHRLGWISSAYYAALPPQDGAPRGGWLHFGEPSFPAPALEPDHAVEPVVGRLVLFPSYMWHGTAPFASAGHRLTAAFDVAPA